MSRLSKARIVSAGWVLCDVVWCTCILAGTVSARDPATIVLALAVVAGIAVVYLRRLTSLPGDSPKQFSLRMLLGIFPLAALLLAFIMPFFGSEEVRSSSDNIVAFTDERLAEDASYTELGFLLTPDIWVELRPVSQGTSRPLLDKNSVVFRIEVRGRAHWWNRIWMMGQPYFPPYSREQFILELESKIDESLSAPDAARVVKLTVPGF